MQASLLMVLGDIWTRLKSGQGMGWGLEGGTQVPARMSTQRTLECSEIKAWGQQEGRRGWEKGFGEKVCPGVVGPNSSALFCRQVTRPSLCIKTGLFFGNTKPERQDGYEGGALVKMTECVKVCVVSEGPAESWWPSAPGEGLETPPLENMNHPKEGPLDVDIWEF